MILLIDGTKQGGLLSIENQFQEVTYLKIWAAMDVDSEIKIEM